MTAIITAFLAYLIDTLFGEFKFFETSKVKHPIIMIGFLISSFEKYFYKDSIFRGAVLVLITLTLVSSLSTFIMIVLNLFPTFLTIMITATVASIFLAHNMLYTEVKNIISASNQKEAIAQLVSRDTKNMSQSDIYKASIETYAENLSDGVIAPLFYLILFGLPGIIIYKTINTMDSMVGYRNNKYENFGKFAAKLDDVVNYIPSRVTALFIMIVFNIKPLLSFYHDGKKHDSPNAGHPITAMALGLNISLGGETSYFGIIKNKPYFGKGRREICEDDLVKALTLKSKLDATVFVLFLLSLTQLF
jgi:adenosylcobinamide-phosphate synthase